MDTYRRFTVVIERRAAQRYPGWAALVVSLLALLAGALLLVGRVQGADHSIEETGINRAPSPLLGDNAAQGQAPSRR